MTPMGKVLGPLGPGFGGHGDSPEPTAVQTSGLTKCYGKVTALNDCTIAASCAQALSHFRGFLTYQPADRFWTFQGIEAGIFLALAFALIAVTAVVLLRRDA